MNRLLWLLMTVYIGLIAIAHNVQQFVQILFSATVTIQSSFMLTTEPACLISLSSLDVCIIDMLKLVGSTLFTLLGFGKLALLCLLNH